MSAWRVVLTDSESMTGVAPVCEDPAHTGAARLLRMTEDHFGPHVFDCCPHPHIECWSEQTAALVAVLLTETEADLCS